GGQTITVSAPLHKIPVFVHAGSIVILGPVRQYVDENRNAPLTVNVYPGADGSFTWYDDAGDGYGYEEGECAVTTLTWDDAASTVFKAPVVSRMYSAPQASQRILAGSFSLKTRIFRPLTIRCCSETSS
ncbi:MAG: DUF5110 domain-containing protein, partial [Clostridia bacterium]|nr:DUF5110 domain-containing protein [Clostridia bacterium]